MPFMTRSIRRRLRIALVAIVCLLFQQVAMAAYLCPQEQAPTQAAASACASMGMAQAKTNPALCQKHCAPDFTTAAGHFAPSVPALALPPLQFALLAAPATHAIVASDVPLSGTDPPPRLRFCSLLI